MKETTNKIKYICKLYDEQIYTKEEFIIKKNEWIQSLKKEKALSKNQESFLLELIPLINSEMVTKEDLEKIKHSLSSPSKEGSFNKVIIVGIIITVVFVLAALRFINSQSKEKHQSEEPTIAEETQVAESATNQIPEKVAFDFKNDKSLFKFIKQNAKALDFNISDMTFDQFDYIYLDYTNDGLDDAVIKSKYGLGLVFVTQQENGFALVKIQEEGLGYGGNEYDFEYSMSQDILSIKYTHNMTEYILLAKVSDQIFNTLNTLRIYEPYDDEHRYRDYSNPYFFYKEEKASIIEIDGFNDFIVMNTFEVKEENSDFKVSYLRNIERHTLDQEALVYDIKMLDESEYLNLIKPQVVTKEIKYNASELEAGDVFASNLIRYIRYETASYNVDFEFALFDFLSNDYLVERLIEEDTLSSSLFEEVSFYAIGKPLLAKILVEKKIFEDMEGEYFAVGSSIISFDDPQVTLQTITRGINNGSSLKLDNKTALYGEIGYFIQDHRQDILDGIKYELEVELTEIVKLNYEGGTDLPILEIRVNSILNSKVK